MFFGEKDPIASRISLADMVNTFQTSFCLEGLKVRYASRLLKYKAQDWWEEVYFALGGEAVETMT